MDMNYFHFHPNGGELWRAPLRARVTPRGPPSRRTCGLHRCPVRLPCAAGGQGACARRRGARQIEWEGDGFGGRRRFGFVGQCPKASCAPLRARCRRRWCAFGAARAVVGLNIPKAATERARSPRGQREVRRCLRNTTTLRPNVFDGVSYLPYHLYSHVATKVQNPRKYQPFVSA